MLRSSKTANLLLGRPLGNLWPGSDVTTETNSPVEGERERGRGSERASGGCGKGEINGPRRRSWFWGKIKVDGEVKRYAIAYKGNARKWCEKKIYYMIFFSVETWFKHKSHLLHILYHYYYLFIYFLLHSNTSWDLLNHRWICSLICSMQMIYSDIYNLISWWL